MTTELIGTLFLSEKRKNLMIYLLDGPMTIDDIKIKLNVNTSAIMTQIKIMMVQGLIAYDNNIYSLTVIGRVIAEKMVPLLDTLEMYSENQKYWESHRVSGFPESLLHRLNELNTFTLVEPELKRMYELPLKFEENLLASSRIREVTSFFSPTYHAVYLDIAARGVDIQIILPKSVFDYFKEDHSTILREYLSCSNAKLFVCKDPIELASCVVTEKFFSFSLFSNTGVYHNHSMMSFAPSSIQFGEDLYDYYFSKSEEKTLEDL